MNTLDKNKENNPDIKTDIDITDTAATDTSAVNETFEDSDVHIDDIDSLEAADEILELQNENAIKLLKKNKRKAQTDGTKRKRSKIKTTLLIIGGMILTFILVFAATLLIMRITGKSSLYNKANSTGPNLLRDDPAGNASDNEIDIDLDDMGNINNINNSGSQGGSSNNGNSNTNNEPSTSHSTIQPAGSNDSYDIIYEGKKYAYNKDMITLLVLGIDSTEPVAPAKDGISGGQSDSIFLVLMNPHTMVMDIIAIPRDTITKLWVYDIQGNFVQTGDAQICLQHGYGDGMEISNERALKAVSYLMYDLPIHSVTSINMGAVGMLNDAIGGVTLESLETFDYAGFSYIKGEPVTLKGNMAYEYVHYRDTKRHNTASERLARQKQYITLFIKQAMAAVKKDLGTVTDVYNIILDYLVTDLSLDEIVYLASEAISYDFGEFITLQGTLDTSRKYERYYLDEYALQKLIVEKFYEEVK